MNKIKLAALAAVGLLYPLSAACDETSGYYAGLYAGYGKTHDSKLRIEGYPPGTLLFEPSYRLGGIAGYDFAGPLRVELDIAWRTAGIDGLEAPAVGKIAAIGELTALSGLVNLLYEFPVEGRLQPHIGAGLGAVRLGLNDAVVDVPGVGLTPVADDSVIVPAWQLLGGVSWPLGQTLDLTVEYRLFGAIGPEFVGAGSTKVEADYTDSTLSLGLRVGF